MIISQTPLRVSFVGGGSDLPAFYREEGGAVLSVAIDKYVYVNVNRKFDNGTRIAYSKTEEVETVENIQHPIVKATMEYLGICGGVEITTIADIPSKGTGLGSSSAFTVGLLHALNAFRGQYVSKAKLGADSCCIEIERCGAPIGRQDQYAAAFGGLNLIEFHSDDSVSVSPLICPREFIAAIEKQVLVFYTGMTRSASDILVRQSEGIAKAPDKRKALRRMVELTYHLRDELHRCNLNAFGEILHENWLLKRSLSEEISNDAIDGWYRAALRAGATGGKLLGAGAGGFLMFFAPPDRHDAIKLALGVLKHFPVKFDFAGSRIVHYQPTSEIAQ
ncbi:GHMP kinase [Mesorhizobium captivum]|uniref:GHMP family kinase ATP-binding protein n=1 Tax=Mesorhizobium captivum TaxID=3072319 RepID=UPI002A23FF74|nr:GHMP kinase [Mesorhizobium sp. VK22E]MDX8507719.1 GHMP kinase [Mesorhizobium sp. VK22E]